MDKKINIGIIGAGQTGTPMLKKLAESDFVNLIGIADLDNNAPGMVYAREKGIRTTNDFMDLANLGTNIDIIIELTGVKDVKKQLREYYQQTENQHTVIMQELVAILLMSLAQGELVKSFHGDQSYQ
ncbi:MAG: oxidoreductase [Bacillales bacterium]|jgi:predicted homoserine dehydrogenase-like protein|nr:oxidoreductase [Bacillales bacterium]